MSISGSLLATVVMTAYMQAVPSAVFEVQDIVSMADRYCIFPDGDAQLTWDLARRDGYVAMDMADFPGLNLPGTRRLSGFSKTTDGITTRVLTAVNRPWNNLDRANFHICWVSADPVQTPGLEAELRDFLGVRSFAQRRAKAFSWIPGADEVRRAINRREFERYWVPWSRDRGLRTVLMSQDEQRVSITYMRPVDSCEDWCY